MKIPDLTLPSGGVVSFLDPEEMLGTHVQAMISAVRRESSETGQAMDLVQAAACMLIESWSIPYAVGKPKEPADQPWPLPTEQPAMLGMLSARDYRSVIEAVSPAIEIIFPKPATPDDAGKPGSPTAPAGG
jgi:hypothetical protein